jgi:arylsulfatase A-like enzyme/phosphatidylethanolamine-binding protein (PEBP) family uncharacterized protein
MHVSTIWAAIAATIGASFVALLSSFAPPSSATRSVGRPPNIVFVLAEAQGWSSTSVDMDGAPPSHARAPGLTPNLERLAADGMRFSDFYATAPRCTPSRASFVTGISPAKLHMTYQNEGGANRREEPTRTRLIPPAPETYLPDGVATTGGALREVGYTTAHFGKWHAGRADPKANGFDVSDGPNTNQGPVRGVEPNPAQAVAITDRAIAFMRDAVRDGKPFFVQVSHYGFGSDDEVTPEALRVAREHYPGVSGKPLAAIAGAYDVDVSLGRLRAALSDLGVAGNTYVIYSSDHGAQGGGGDRRGGKLANPPFVGAKGSVSEGGIRVPFLMAGPGVAPGTTSTVRATGMDLLPTLRDLAGSPLQAPKDRDARTAVEGGSLAPILRGGGTGIVRRPREEIVIHFPHYDLNNGGPASAIYLGDHKLVRNDDTGTISLYEIAKDPSESTNLASAMPERTAELIRRLDAYLVAVGAQRAVPRDGGNAEVPATALATPAAPPQAASFEAFAPHVHTHADERWLYVESDGLPHPPQSQRIMVGITAWQQQVPLPQPYVGANAWQIPLRPALAATPISGRNALMRGAVAVAANGIPIFNALNNRGEDSFAIGELDEFGGHCGRADDYHYHAAPLALEKIVGKGKPIAYALDGFPLYGLFDPKAAPDEDRACPFGSHEPLDEFNGHFCEMPAGQGIGGGTRGYHYHASTTYPYVNGGLRGAVALEGTGRESQVTPQPRARSVRPAQEPLRGARITDFTQDAPRTWTLRYAVDGATSSITYEVDDQGGAVFRFKSPDGDERVERFTPEARPQRGTGERPPREPRDDQRPRRGQRADRSPPATSSGFTLECAGVGTNGLLDKRHTCNGESVSPPFAWRGAPAATASFALTIHHVTPDGDERVYLVLTDIPSVTTALAAAQTSIGRFGLNSVNRRAEYAPPCSKGPGEKTYVATLYALSKPLAPSDEPRSRSTLLDALKDRTLATATLELRYARPDGAEAAPPKEPREGRRRNERPAPPPAPRDDPPKDDGRGLIARMTAFQTDVPVEPLDVVLVRPTSTSMTLAARSRTAGTLVAEWWPATDSAATRTAAADAAAGVTATLRLDGLAPGTEYRYRVGTRAAEVTAPTWLAPRGFRTPAPAGTPFGFVIQADSHLDANMNVDAYRRTLQSMRAEAVAGNAEFLVDLGDTFMADKRGRDFERALPQYDAQRHYFGIACDVMPLFMVLGNHDGETGDAANGMAAWSYRERTSRFPPPEIDGVAYTGATAMREGRGSNYYAFHWGDALLVVLDPFWPTTERARGGGGNGGGRNAEPLVPVDESWSRTLGREQYDWLERTLATSKAKQKLVFIHHLVGGIGGAAARGGVESAPYFEWGGKNADGSDGFAARRPGWPMPIHDLLVKHGVTAVFHGHDHLYVHSELDGIHYQCVPQPGNVAGGTRSAAEYGYDSGRILGSPGYLRVRVAADGVATVEYVRTALDGGRGAAEPNGTVVDRYEIRPRG